MKTKTGFCAVVAAVAVMVFAAGAQGKDAVTGPKGYFGVFGNLWFYTYEHKTASSTDDLNVENFSGGVSFIGEGYAMKYLAIGGMLDITGLAPGSHDNVLEVAPLISVDLTLRGIIPLGAFEVYGRAAVGYTALIPSVDDLRTWQGIEDTEHGWNVRLGAGFSWRADMGLTVSLEAGWTGVGYLHSMAGGPVHVLYHSPYVSFGMGYSF